MHHDPSLTSIYQLSSTEISRIFSLTPNNASIFHSDLHHDEQKSLLKADLKKYAVLTIVDDSYPVMLKAIKDPPLVLYALGDLSLLKQQPALSVIGTRKPSREAPAKMEFILKPLIEQKWLIVSGMAIGIDSYAHRLALQGQAKTIAVLGGGFHHIYPKQNTLLFQQIAKHGLVLSEYPPDMSPKKYHFPERNRIISGLSFGTLVIEAAEKSGTLITVDQALDQGREVYAVPGSPLFSQTKGCHKMIQDGAKLVYDAQDIREDWDQLEQIWEI